MDYWSPVDWYNGGMEHTTLHLLYSRFWHKFLYDIGVVPTKEPYAKRTSHGMILGRGWREDVQVPRQRSQSQRHRSPVRRRHHAPAHHVHRRLREGRQLEQRGCQGQQALPGSLLEPHGAAARRKISGKNESIVHKTIKKVSQDIDELKMNTAIAAMMAMVNEFYSSGLTRGDLQQPDADALPSLRPHMVEEMWENIGLCRQVRQDGHADGLARS